MPPEKFICECNLGFTRDSDMCEGKESCQHVIFDEGCKSVARAVLLPAFQFNNYGIITTGLE